MGEKINSWQKVKLGDIANVRTGKKDVNASDPNGVYPFFTCSQKISKINKYSFDTEAVLVAGNGDFNVKYYNGKFDAYQRTYVIEGAANNFVSYLFYKIQESLPVITKRNQGSTIKYIKLGDLNNFTFLLPPLPEQRKIAAILSTVDEDIGKTEEIIVQTEKLKRGLMQKLLTKGIGHKKFKKTKLGEIPEEWEVVNFEELSVLQRGFDLPKRNRVNGSYPLVTSSGIADTHNEYKVNGPGVFTGRSGTIGDVYFVESNYWPLNTTLYVKDFKNNDKKFVFYLMQWFNLGRFNSGTGVPTLNRNIVHKEKIAIPNSLTEQKQIARILSNIDNKIEIDKRIKNKLALLKKGLMRDLLSGKVMVNLAYFDDYFEDCNYKKTGCEFGYNPTWNKEIDKRLEFYYKISPEYYKLGKTKIEVPKQRDESLGEIKAVYYISEYLGGTNFIMEPDGQGDSKIDFSYIFKKGKKYCVEVKSPSWRNEIWKDSSLTKEEKKRRCEEPKYKNECRSFTAEDAIRDSIKKSLQQFEVGNNNVLFITPNMFVETFNIPKDNLQAIVKKELKEQDPDNIISKVAILEDYLPADNKRVEYNYQEFINNQKS